MKLDFSKIDRKKLLRGIVIGLIVVVIVLTVFFLSLPYLIKGSIQTVGSILTGVPMDVSKIFFNPFNGKLSIQDFIVGNPEGYSSPYSFRLGEFVVDLDMTTLMSSKLVIEQIRIRGVRLNYESSLINSNLAEIQKNLNKNLGINPDESSKPKQKSTPGKPLQINHLELSGITASVIVKGTSKGMPMTLVPIELNNLGTAESGITSAVVINDILVSMLTSLGESVKLDKASKQLGKGIDITTNTANKAAGAAAAAFDSGVKSINRLFRSKQEKK